MLSNTQTFSANLHLPSSSTILSNGFAPSTDNVGPPLAGVSLRAVDGRIQIRGLILLSGCLEQPPLPEDTWFDTGDLGETDDRGRLRIHARRNDVIVTGGENVYSAEIERVLESLPGISAAGVFGVPDDVWGQTVAAALVADRPPSLAELAGFCASRLAPFKRPRRICFIAGLPHTPAGKLDRGGLSQHIEALKLV